MPDLRRFGQTLNRILPFLANEKMQREQVRRWLESNLQEIEAREASTARGQARGAEYDAALNLLGSIGRSGEKRAGAEWALPGQYKAIAPGITGGIEELPGAAEKREEVKRNMGVAATQAQLGLKIPPAVIGQLVDQLPSNEVFDLAQAIESAGLKRVDQAFAEKQLAKDIYGQKLRERELDIQEKGLKGGGAKDAAAVMKEAQNDLETSLKQVAGVGGFYGPAGLASETKQALKASIGNAQRKIDAASKAAGIESPIKTKEERDEDELAIVSHYVKQGELPNWYTLIFLGYDPEFVFNLRDRLEKPDKKSKVSDENMMKKAMALLETMRGGKVD